MTAASPFIEPLPDLDRMLDVVAKFFNLRPAWFFETVRARQTTVSRARMLLCWMANEWARCPDREIAHFLHRDRSTVFTSRAKVRAALENDARLREHVEKLRELLGF